MADEKDSSSATVVLAFLSGAALGAIAALLLAPHLGEETQRRLRGLAKKAGKSVRQVAGKAEEAWEEAIEQGREFVQDKQPILAAAVEAGRRAMNRVRARTMGTKKTE